MQIFTNDHPDIHPGYPVEEMAPLNRILFIDIETTGLSREHTDLYMIGCGWFDRDGYNTIQWFADSSDDEASLIEQFNDYIIDRFTLLIHYNGNHFDIPYLRYKADKYGLPDPFDSIESYDIYAAIKPYKNTLGLSSLRQREIEQLLDINSDDPYTGRDLIDVYHRYVKAPSDELLEPLLYHNNEDLKGMAYILPVLYYTEIGSIRFGYVSHEIHKYENYEGKECAELLICCRHDLYIPKSFKTSPGPALISVRTDKTALIRLPLVNGTLKLFYDNYRDYYYLPYEDCCVHRSVASGVDTAHREPARRETCYVKHTGLFFPLPASVNGCDPDMSSGKMIRDPVVPASMPIFRESYNSGQLYTAYREETAEEVLIQITEGIRLL